MKKYLIYIFFVVIILITYFTYNNDNKEEIIIEEEVLEEVIVDEIKPIVVDVKGAVKKPGVYELLEGQRVVDAISKSGGTIKGARTETLNLSKLLEDQMVIYVYKFEEEKIVCEEIVECPIINCQVPKNDACIEGEDITLENEEKSIISINNATSTELQTLPGIGEAKSLDIINYREANNGFIALEDLMKVTGIGEATFNKLKEFIKL